MLNRIGGSDMNGLRALFIHAEIKRRELAGLDVPDS